MLASQACTQVMTEENCLLAVCRRSGQKIKDALHARDAAPVVVELDWKESVLHEDDR